MAHLVNQFTPSIVWMQSLQKSFFFMGLSLLRYLSHPLLEHWPRPLLSTSTVTHPNTPTTPAGASTTARACIRACGSFDKRRDETSNGRHNIESNLAQDCHFREVENTIKRVALWQYSLSLFILYYSIVFRFSSSKKIASCHGHATASTMDTPSTRLDVWWWAFPC